ncbi:MAG: DUF1624 domain-containing protein [Kordiimonadaceae bacterium]|jgi:uncharacterized membrane protein|nr:DUF1624 domain-containing protein [Kordiimonadaceae bacterium]MBT6033855.1 DUF1624 domain-containing protein [Kordiimonadaceae bacterium]
MNMMNRVMVEERITAMNEGVVEVPDFNYQDKRAYRLTNIDMLRGLVILIMALDHVRDFMMMGGVQDPMAQPDISAGLYFTRWITHFCAPVFIFLAGTSVGLMSARKSAKEIGGFVLKRGLWLIFMEVTLISTAWTFTPFGEAAVGGSTIIVLQVIWALGVSMIVLAGAQFMGPRACLILGAAIILGHNLLDPIWPNLAMFGAGTDAFWTTIHSQNSLFIDQYYVNTVYPALPCIGIMLLGYGTTFIFQKSPKQRDAFLIKTGLVFLAAFVTIRFLDIYGDPNPWQVQEYGALATFFDFMNVSKYPASLLYILATLGVMALVCSQADKLKGWLKDTLVMFGRVPFAFYVLHLYLIHAMAVLLGMGQGFEFNQMMHFFPFYPEGYGVGLVEVYVGWVLVIAILYPFCKWVAKIKSTRKDWWLSYV